MIPYGYRDKRTRGIFGPKHFEMSSATEQLTAIYLQPVYEGQKPFACTRKDNDMFFYEIEYIGKYKDFVPLYEGVENGI